MYIQSLTSQMLLDPCRETASGFSKKGFISSSMPSLMDEIPFCHLPLLYISFNTWDTGTKTYTQRKFFFFIYHMGYVTQSYTTQFGLYGFLLLTQTMFVSVTIMYKKKKKNRHSFSFELARESLSHKPEGVKKMKQALQVDSS